MDDRRMCFDFEVEFSNGGGIQGQDFRLDIHGDLADNDLAAYVVRDLRLLMVSNVRILNKRIVKERHKRGSDAIATAHGASRSTPIDLSHTIESGMVTYKGLPAPLICDHLSRERSRAFYDPGTEFQIDSIEMVGNTGTYLDTPYHRYADGYDLAGLALERVADCQGVVVRVSPDHRSVDWLQFGATEIKGKAVLINTGWDRHWRTDAYFERHPHLTEKAACYLRDQGALLVGIDSFNIDDTSGKKRPVHSALLEAGIPIVEHLTALDRLPISGFRFSAVPPKIERMGTFPVRAHAFLN